MSSAFCSTPAKEAGFKFLLCEPLGSEKEFATNRFALFPSQMTSLFNGVVKSSASYYIIVHYRQPNSLSKKVEQISITDYEKRNISVTFHYCPANPGCRIVVGEEENLSFRFSKGIFTATIQHERRTHLVGREKMISLYELTTKGFQYLYFDGSILYHSSSVDATIMVSNEYPIIDEKVVVIFLA